MTKSQLRALQADVQDVLQLHPELSLVEKNNIPTAIQGKYNVRDDKRVVQGVFDIRVVIPQNYPNEFPILIEKSKNIERKIDRHINPHGIACEEINQMEKIIAAKGITIRQYFDRYVHKYFCWQLVYDEEGNQNLDEWEHEGIGVQNFYRQYLSLNDDATVFACISLIALNRIPGRNDPCPCKSGKKVKQCHGKTFDDLKCIGKDDLLKDMKLFSINQSLKTE